MTLKTEHSHSFPCCIACLLTLTLIRAVQDLYKPDSNRLRRNLSGIINFAKFREEKLVPYTDMQESVEHLLEDTAELQELNLRLVHMTHTHIAWHASSCMAYCTISYSCTEAVIHRCTNKTCQSRSVKKPSTVDTLDYNCWLTFLHAGLSTLLLPNLLDLPAAIMHNSMPTLQKAGIINLLCSCRPARWPSYKLSGQPKNQ